MSKRNIMTKLERDLPEELLAVLSGEDQSLGAVGFDDEDMVACVELNRTLPDGRRECIEYRPYKRILTGPAPGHFVGERHLHIKPGPVSGYVGFDDQVFDSALIPA